jgi:hypothetical protein
LPLNVF